MAFGPCHARLPKGHLATVFAKLDVLNRHKDQISIQPNKFHGEWNYVITPKRR